MTPSNAAAGVPQVCWSCHSAAAGEHFCASCGKIQPVASSSDYFALLGLPPKLRIDAAALEFPAGIATTRVRRSTKVGKWKMEIGKGVLTCFSHFPVSIFLLTRERENRESRVPRLFYSPFSCC